MKTFLIMVLLLFTIIIVYFFILGIQSKSKEAPGLTAGRLAKCPGTPNCICTEYIDDTGHYLAPINLPQALLPTFDGIAVASEIIKTMGGKVQQKTKNYLSATFTSAIFGFVDDFEVRYGTGKDPSNHVINIRSASRVGRGDLGVNKKRIELFKQLYNKKISSPGK